MEVPDWHLIDLCIETQMQRYDRELEKPLRQQHILKLKILRKSVKELKTDRKTYNYLFN